MAHMGGIACWVFFFFLCSLPFITGCQKLDMQCYYVMQFASLADFATTPQWHHHKSLRTIIIAIFKCIVKEASRNIHVVKR